MTRRMTMLRILIVLVLLASTIPVSAHVNFRIIGTIVTITDTTLAVKQTRDGKTISMAMDPKTLVVLRAKKKVPLTELKVGLSVVVGACGDKLEELEAVEVRIVAPTAKTTASSH